jgi:hypothetical protein
LAGEVLVLARVEIELDAIPLSSCICQRQARSGNSRSPYHTPSRSML